MLFKKIVDEISDSSFPWHYSSSAYKIERNDLFNYSFSHTLYCDKEIKSRTYPLAYAAFNDFMLRNDESLNEILRIRTGLIGVTSTPYIHEPHVDFSFEHKTALIYLNESDGPTTFYNEIYNPESNVDPRDYCKKHTVDVKIDPEPNKIIIFNGLKYHTSCTPTIVPRRLVMNFNYI